MHISEIDKLLGIGDLNEDGEAFGYAPNRHALPDAEGFRIMNEILCSVEIVGLEQ